jgi:hypothetical protein
VSRYEELVIGTLKRAGKPQNTSTIVRAVRVHEEGMRLTMQRMCRAGTLLTASAGGHVMYALPSQRVQLDAWIAEMAAQAQRKADSIRAKQDAAAAKAAAKAARRERYPWPARSPTRDACRPVRVASVWQLGGLA